MSGYAKLARDFNLYSGIMHHYHMSGYAKLARDFGIVFLPAELTTWEAMRDQLLTLGLFCDPRNGSAWIVMFVSYSLLSCAIMNVSAKKFSISLSTINYFLTFNYILSLCTKY